MTDDGDGSRGDGSRKLNGHGREQGDNIVPLPDLAGRKKLRREKEEEQRGRQRQNKSSEPMLNLPPLTAVLVSGFILIHFLFSVLLPESIQLKLVFDLGFVPGRYSGYLDAGWQALAGPLTYAFLHGSWLHVAMNGVMLLAFGSGIERWMGSARMMVFFMSCSLVAALTQLAVDPSSTNPVIGASGGISGLFAAALIMLQAGGSLPMGRRGIMPLIVVWIGITILFGLMGSPDGESVAWPAHIGGFLGGFLILRIMQRLWP